MQVGDKVLIEDGLRETEYTITTIERETNTQWITANGERWHKKDNKKVGASIWYPSKIHELTPERLAKFKEWADAKKHNALWHRIIACKRPKHLDSKRLKEILEEIEGK